MRRPAPADAGIAIALLALVAAGGMVRVESSQSRYAPHRHQQRDVHRYYVSPAESFLAGHGWETDYGQNFIPPPLQGVFVAVVEALDRDATYGTLRWVQAWCGALGILLAFCVGREMGGKWTGLLAAGLFAFDPRVVELARSLLPETNYLTLLLGFLAVLLLALRTERTWLFAAAGALLGLTSLMKPFPTLLAALIPAYVWTRERTAKGAVRAAALAACFAFVVSPWIARNWVRYGEIHPISTNGGIALAMANYVDLDASEQVYWEQIQKSGRWRVESIERRFFGRRDADGKLQWNERDRAYARHAMGYIVSHPRHFARNYAIKLYNAFRYPLERRQGWRGLALPSSLALGLVGLVAFAATQRRRPAWVLVWIFAYYALFTALFHITRSGRLNLPLKVLLGFFAAWALVAGIRSAARATKLSEAVEVVPEVQRVDARERERHRE